MKWESLEEALLLEALSSWCGEAPNTCSRAPRSTFHRLYIGQERPGHFKAFACEDQADCFLATVLRGRQNAVAKREADRK